MLRRIEGLMGWVWSGLWVRVLWEWGEGGRRGGEGIGERGKGKGVRFSWVV